MNFNEYLTAWIAYVAAVGVFTMIGWAWTRPLGNAYVRNAVRAIAVAIMLSSVPHSQAPEIWVPAVTVVLVGGVTGEQAEVIHAGIVMAATIGVALLISLLLVRLTIGRNKPVERTEPVVNDH